jgi:phosphoribosyl 1,2-cyclic phosphate phosphodiesterase
MKVLFLGTGTSHGVPSIDCMLNDYLNCPKAVCVSSIRDKKHRRTRSSILVETTDGNILIDVSADFRYQALRESVKKIDAVLITHGHADHIGGIPDIRSYTTKTALPFFGSWETVEAVRKSYDYIFDSSTFVGGGIPRIEINVIDREISMFGHRITPIKVAHGSLREAYGYRIGSLGYIPDIKAITDMEINKLQGIDTLILNCLRVGPIHPSHLTLAESVCLAKRIAPRRCYFIHMCHDIHYELDSSELEPWMEFSFDGLKIEV